MLPNVALWKFKANTAAQKKHRALCRKTYWKANDIDWCKCVELTWQILPTFTVTGLYDDRISHASHNEFASSELCSKLTQSGSAPISATTMAPFSDDARSASAANASQCTPHDKTESIDVVWQDRKPTKVIQKAGNVLFFFSAGLHAALVIKNWIFRGVSDGFINSDSHSHQDLRHLCIDAVFKPPAFVKDITATLVWNGMCQVDGPNTKSCLNSHFA